MKVKVSILFLVTVLIGLIIFPALRDNIIVSKSFTFKSENKKKIWAKNDTISFNFNYNKDETVSLDLFFRINQHYNQYSNLFLFCELINTYSNDTIVDTLEFQIYDSWGKCLGSGPSGIKTFEKNYKQNYPLSKGDYLLQIIQGMRADSLQGLEDIGFKIKKQ